MLKPAHFHVSQGTHSLFLISIIPAGGIHEKSCNHIHGTANTGYLP